MRLKFPLIRHKNLLCCTNLSVSTIHSWENKHKNCSDKIIQTIEHSCDYSFKLKSIKFSTCNIKFRVENITPTFSVVGRQLSLWREVTSNTTQNFSLSLFFSGRTSNLGCIQMGIIYHILILQNTLKSLFGDRMTLGKLTNLLLISVDLYLQNIVSFSSLLLFCNEI